MTFRCELLYKNGGKESWKKKGNDKGLIEEKINKKRKNWTKRIEWWKTGLPCVSTYYYTCPPTNIIFLFHPFSSLSLFLSFSPYICMNMWYSIQEMCKRENKGREKRTSFIFWNFLFICQLPFLLCWFIAVLCLCDVSWLMYGDLA